MSESEHIARALRGLFSDPRNRWFTPFLAALDGLDARQAQETPAPRLNSVWAVVEHVAFWHERFLRRYRGEPTDEEAARRGGWSMPETRDERAWEVSKERLARLNAELAEIVRGMSDEELERESAPGRAHWWQVFHGLIGHTSYHTAEVITIRQVQGSWGDRPV